MSRIEEARHFVQDYYTAEQITGALQYISAAKMQELRVQFEQNARLFNGVNEVYGIIKAHAKTEAAADRKRNPSERDLYVGLTSNRRFYGTLNREVVRAFVSLVETVENGDFLMIGQTGAQYLQEIPSGKKIERMEFSDDSPDVEDLQRILLLISGYPRVFVVYPKFINPFRQDVIITDITEAPETIVSADDTKEYIFEPEVPQMLQFFENQVRRAIFGRIMLETELARSAARTMRMHSAKDRAASLRHVYERSLQREYAAVSDIERMESFIGSISWRL